MLENLILFFQFEFFSIMRSVSGGGADWLELEEQEKKGKLKSSPTGIVGHFTHVRIGCIIPPFLSQINSAIVSFGHL